MYNGSVVVTREPGWWLAGTIAGIVATFAGLVAYLARRKGYSVWLFGLSAFVAPPPGFLLAATARRKMGAGPSFR